MVVIVRSIAYWYPNVLLTKNGNIFEDNFLGEKDTMNPKSCGSLPPDARSHMAKMIEDSGMLAEGMQPDLERPSAINPRNSAIRGTVRLKSKNPKARIVAEVPA